MIEERKTNEEHQLDYDQLLTFLNDHQVDAFREEF
jgi:magnesium transporter